MTFFDDEEKVVKAFQDTSIFDISFYNFSPGLLGFFLSLYIKLLFREWINNTESRPDFINRHSKMMLELMRFDDYEDNGFSQNQVESKRRKNLVDKFLKQYGRKPDPNNDLLMPNCYLDSRSKHDLDTYYQKFSKTVRDHSRKISAYKDKYPDYKLAFMLVDEAAAYLETKEKLNNVPRPGDLTGPCRLYEPVFDKRYVNVLMSLNVDYIVWFAPYRQFKSLNNYRITKVHLIDVRKLKQKQRYIDYDFEKIYSSEPDEEDM